MKAEYRSKSSRAPRPEENRVESIRASQSSIMCRILAFQFGGMIWRTGTLVFSKARQLSAKVLDGLALRTADVLRECCGKAKARA
ncbi:MAG: hypothetical protein WA702_13050 [Bradyrhizobium sp.]|uniref:hypothetical protein n=1 Tax=Bradyrhizobium sp. TaxID=376 RepID=UPI003C7A4E1C